MTGKQLKNSILQLAIQGKLVPQDPHDEPASELLKRIRKEKEQLVLSGDIKLSKPEKSVKRIECSSFDVPKTWTTCQLIDICRAFGRIGFRGYTKEDLVSGPSKGAISLSPSNMKENGMDYSDCTYITWEKYDESPEIKIEKGDILIVKTGSSYGKTIIVENLPHSATINPQIAVIKDIKVNPYYLMYFLKSPFARDCYEDFVLGTSIPTFSQLNLLSIEMPLPPLTEQHRIVEKIEELMPLVEEYDKAQSELDKLNESLPEQLKKSILQQAIMGKLVPQDPNDEPASELLKRIHKEKENLVKSGALKKKDLITTLISDDEKPFDIPESWEWVHFEEIAQGLCGKTPERGNQDYWLNPKYPWVSISDMTDYGHVKNTKEGISDKTVGIMREISKKGDLLMSFKLTVGRTSILDIDAYHNEAIITVKLFFDTENNLRDYLFRFLPLITSTGETKDAIKGRTLNAKSIAALMIPLPPIAEQRRIVAKIEELFSILK